MQLPALLLFRAWLASPARAIAGVGGITLIVWSVLPLAARPIPRPISEFVEDVTGVWGRNRIRAIAGIVGFGLFLWSAWPIATMR